MKSAPVTSTARRRRTGFSLMEMLVVVVIIGLLAVLVGTRIVGGFGGSQRKVAGAMLTQLEGAVESFKVDHGRYPTAEEGLTILVEKPAGMENWKNYLGSRTVPKDPWGNAYVYRTDDPSFPYVIISYGADGQPGGEGENADLDNWQ